MRNSTNQTKDNSSASQRKKILDWLKTSTLTTIEAKERLGVMAPAARIRELRRQGFNIATRRQTCGSQDRVACYVLLAGGSYEH